MPIVGAAGVFKRTMATCVFCLAIPMPEGLTSVIWPWAAQAGETVSTAKANVAITVITIFFKGQLLESDTLPTSV